MKILQVMAGAEHGGAEGFFERLVPALTRAGIDQRALIRRNEDRGRLLEDQGVETEEARFGGRFDFSTGKAVRRAIEDFRPDIVMAWMSRAAARLPDCDAVTVGRLGGYYDLKYYRRCDHLIGNTPDIRDYLVRSGLATDRAWYLPNFVDDVVAAPASRRDLDTPDDAPLLLCLGRLHRNKGFDIALQALSGVDGAYLWIAGTGPLEDDLKRQANSLGLSSRVRFLGWRQDVAALLAAADVFVCSSRHEPLGNIVLEAWAHGTPVAACAAQGPAQLITDGETGLLSPVDDANALSSSINRLIAEPALGVDIAGRAATRFRDEFSEGPVVAQYLSFFEAILARGKI